MRRLALVIVPIIALAAAGCGSTSGDGLSANEEAKLKTALSKPPVGPGGHHQMGVGEAKMQKMQAGGVPAPTGTTS